MACQRSAPQVIFICTSVAHKRPGCYTSTAAIVECGITSVVNACIWSCIKLFTRIAPWFIMTSRSGKGNVQLLPPPRRICNHCCLFVCLSVSNFAQIFRTDLHEIFREGWQWENEQMIKFWWRSQIRIPDPYRDTGKACRPWRRYALSQCF